MPSPLVSILIPCFNHQAFVEQCLRALIAQTYANLELILIDDGSKDDSYERAKALEPQCDARFKAVHIEKKANEGVAKTLNRALALARGEYVFHVASDDWVEPTLIARLIEIAQRDPRVGLACADAEIVDRDGQRIYLSPEGRSTSPDTPGAAATLLQHYAGRRPDFDYRRDFGEYWTFLRGNYIPIGLLVRRVAQLETGGYDTTYRAEDYDSWLKLAKHWRFQLLDEPLAHYRWHSANTVVVQRPAVLRDCVRLFLRERDYSFAHGHGRLWREIFEESFSRSLLVLLETRDYRSVAALLRHAGVGQIRPALGTVVHYVREERRRAGAGAATR